MDSSSANAAPFSPSASFNPEDMQGSAKGGTAGEVRHPYYAPYFPYTTMLLIASIGIQIGIKITTVTTIINKN